jgi:hypothetical protein
MTEYTVTVENGITRWYLNGKQHREDGPAIEDSDGTRSWYINGEPHREDGPAVEYGDGTRSWWINGELHREDGPAVERSDGTRSWYINGQKLSESEFNSRLATQELSIAEIEKLLGFKVKVIK